MQGWRSRKFVTGYPPIRKQDARSLPSSLSAVTEQALDMGRRGEGSEGVVMTLRRRRTFGGEVVSKLGALRGGCNCVSISPIGSFRIFNQNGEGSKW